MASSVDAVQTDGLFWKIQNEATRWSSSSFDGAHKNSGNAGVRWKRMNSVGDCLPVSFQKGQSHLYNDDADREEIEEFFNKTFTFTPPELGWELPLEKEMYSTAKWKIDELASMKDELNAVKNKLNNFNLDEWHKHTRAMNKAGSVLWTLKKEVDPEFATQAWCKFYEICNSYEVVSKTAQDSFSLNSVHLCEAPGAFITSLNHFLKLNFPDMRWNWISTTLNPYHEENPLSNMINDDRFILHTLDRWKFGHDFTGNLMDIENLRYMVNEATRLGGITVVTADGSIDCQNDPGEQELIVSQLIFCEVVCALHVLSLGGSFIVKMFTMYEPETICLVYLLVCCFETVNVHKPATSKEGNSEVYVVCLDYKGTEDMKPWLRKLRDEYGPEPGQKVMFPLDLIPESFLDQLKECAKKFKNYQVEVIERNIYLFKLDNNQQSLKRMRRLRYLVAEEYIRRYNLKKLFSEEDQVVGREKLTRTQTPNIDPRMEEGSFNDKIEREKMHPLEKLKDKLECIEKMKTNWEYGGIKWLQFPRRESKFKIEIGKPVTSVRSSKFCLGRLLRIRNDVQKLTKDHFKSFSPKTCPSEEYAVSRTLSEKITEFIRQECPEIVDDKDLTVLNYKAILWASLDSGQNERYQRNSFFDIMDIIDEAWRGSSLIIQGYPMLTQFTAGVIYMMGHLYERVGFIKPNDQDFAVIFHEFRSWDTFMHRFVDELDDRMDALEKELNKSVLTVIPLTELIYGHDEFYSCVTAVNNLCVQEQVCDIIKKVVQSQ